MNPLTLFSLKESYPKQRLWRRFLNLYRFFIFFYWIPFLYAKKILFITKASFPITYATASFTLNILLALALQSFAIQTWLNLKRTPRD